MNMWKTAILFVAVLHLCIAHPTAQDDEEERAKEFLETLNKEYAERLNRATLADWDYDSNLTDSNLKHKLDVANEVAAANKESWKEVQKFNWQSFKNESLRRQFKLYSILGTQALEPEDLTKFNNIVSDMSKVFATAKVCDYHDPKNCELAIEPELTDIFANSRDEPELKHAWIEWRNAVGPNVRDMYKDYVTLSNKAAALNNFTNNAEMWLGVNYDDPDMKNEVEQLWVQLKPLYLQIHAYTRYQLRKFYGKDVVTEKGPIPAHLLGNMWAQTWENVAPIFLPYPDKADVDITTKLKEQNYTVDRIFKTAEEFFTSIDLYPMPQTFWDKSILEKPEGIDLVCHASAWDFYDAKDFRIKECTEITEDHFVTTHHEMGHIEYFIAYKGQPIQFRNGANSGFHEAIGDLIALSVKSNKHLRKLGLLDTTEDDPEAIINSLFKQGMEKITFLPFGYLIDAYRWSIFEGTTTPEDYNCKWWELREKYQGLEPPVDRSEKDFDAAAKYHVVADVPYIRYFVSFVIQFQFHRALCQVAGEYDPNDSTKPLHQCDIYQNKEAGDLLKKMLALGSSVPWPEAFEVLTGQKMMDASGILEFFKPLQTWLEEVNAKNGAFIGWEASQKVCSSKLS